MKDVFMNIRVSLNEREAFTDATHKRNKDLTPSKMLRQLMGDYAAGRIRYRPEVIRGGAVVYKPSTRS